MYELMLSLSGDAGGPTEKVWTEIVPPSGPSLRGTFAVATYGTAIYMFGGLINGVATGELWRFDVVTKEWTQLTSAPAPIYLHRMVAVNNKLYSYGGYSGSGYVGILRVYDIATNTWSVIASPPANTVGKANVQMATIDSAIYIMGGVDETTSNGRTGFVKLETYPTPVYTTLTAHPVPVSNGYLAVYDDMLFSSHGSYNNGTNINNRVRQYDIYNPGAGWVDKANIPNTNTTSRAFGTTVTVDDVIWYMGSAYGSPKIEAYNVTTNTYITDTGFSMEGDPGGSRGFTVRNKQYFISPLDNKIRQLDMNANKPQPAFVLIPHQEFITSLDYANTAMGGAGTASGVGTNWCQVRATDGKTYIYPQRFLRRGINYSQSHGGNYTFNGMTMKPLVPEDTASAASIWDGVNSCLTKGAVLSNAGIFPRVANYRNETMGFSPSGLVWTDVESGDSEHKTRGGNSYNQLAITQNNTALLGFKAVFELTAGESPW
jgi:hypothetical protein